MLYELDMFNSAWHTKYSWSASLWVTGGNHNVARFLCAAVGPISKIFGVCSWPWHWQTNMLSSYFTVLRNCNFCVFCSCFTCCVMSILVPGILFSILIVFFDGHVFSRWPVNAKKLYIKGTVIFLGLQYNARKLSL